MRRLLVLALVVIVVAPAAAMAAVRSSADSGERVVVLTIRHSKFVPAVIDGHPGERLRVEVRNTDFIDHELIVGDDAVHDRHEKGTEAVHAPRRGEVSIAAGKTAVTTWKVTGTVRYACHLPGHLAYGMSGVLRVR